MSKKFIWKTYNVPRNIAETNAMSDYHSNDGNNNDNNNNNNNNKHHNHEKGDIRTMRKKSTHVVDTFTLRHLKQGATGAVKTWPVSEVLLEYLVQHGGLRHLDDKIVSNEHFLDLNCLPSQSLLNSAKSKRYNILELGGGTGHLSIGLALALKNDEMNDNNNVQLICTDNDRATIKNMRYNIINQPPEMNIAKTVRVEPLDWGCDIGGEKFSNATKSQFQMKEHKRRNYSSVTTKTRNPSKNDCKEQIEQDKNDDDDDDDNDPIRLISHVIASDIHYGLTTIGPLSSIISAMKLRNPEIQVILLLKERSADNSVEDLKAMIETKVHSGVIAEESNRQEYTGKPHGKKLKDFSVTIREVLHSLPNMKMVEC